VFINVHRKAVADTQHIFFYKTRIDENVVVQQQCCCIFFLFNFDCSSVLCMIYIHIDIYIYIGLLYSKPTIKSKIRHQW
jgi:hypothetical protein